MDGQEILGQFSDNGALNAIIGGSIVLLLIVLAIAIAFLVIYIIGAVKLYQKAGKPGWAAIVPFYNTYVLTEIAGLNWWYFLIGIAGSLITIIGIDNSYTLNYLASGVFNFFAFYNISKKFNKEPIPFAVLSIFFTPIIMMIFGFSKSFEFDNNVAVSPNGPVSDNPNSSKTTKEPERYCLGCGRKLNPGTAYCENCGKKVDE